MSRALRFPLLALAWLLLPGNLAVAGPADDQYDLTADERKELRLILKRDEYFAKVNKSLKNIENLIRLGGTFTPGPGKLVLKWSRGTWNGFTAGIKGIEDISNKYTCGLVMVAAEGHYFPDTNLDFWSDLYVFRNCPPLR